MKAIVDTEEKTVELLDNDTELGDVLELVESVFGPDADTINAVRIIRPGGAHPIVSIVRSLPGGEWMSQGIPYFPFLGTNVTTTACAPNASPVQPPADHAQN